MASSSNTPTGSAAPDPTALVVESLNLEIQRSRGSREAAANAALLSSPSTAGSPIGGATSQLACTLANCLANLHRSSTRPYAAKTRASRGPSPATSSDSSRGEMERNNAALGSPDMNAGSKFSGKGISVPSPSFDVVNQSGQARPVMRALPLAGSSGIQPVTSLAPPRRPSDVHAAARGKSLGPATGKVSKPAAKRRSRASRKTPTPTIQTPPENFRATVQQLTGCPTSVPHVMDTRSAYLVENLEIGSTQAGRESVLRPQPQRPPSGSDTIDINSESQASALGVPLESLPATNIAPVAPSTSSLRPPVVSMSYQESWSKSRGLNYVMGFDDPYSSSFIEALNSDEDLDISKPPTVADHCLYRTDYSPGGASEHLVNHMHEQTRHDNLDDYPELNAETSDQVTSWFA